jgi:hypothetical protein
MKYQAIINFSINEAMSKLVLKHRAIITQLIDAFIIESYTLSLETNTAWIVFNAESKEEVMNYLKRSPMYHLWDHIEIEEIFAYDSYILRWPEPCLN